MTTEEMVAELEACHPAAADAMDALFAFSEAMDKGVTTADLIRVAGLAIEDGHDMLIVALVMATEAVKRAKDARVTAPTRARPAAPAATAPPPPRRPGPRSTSSGREGPPSARP